jgi:4'-phosphopantetheinyl transferase EntD
MRVDTEQTFVHSTQTAPSIPEAVVGSLGGLPPPLAGSCIEYDGDLCSEGESAGARRRAEFALGRLCAASVLRQLRASDFHVGRGERGMPEWPQGFVGSITHTPGLIAAVAARASECCAVGLDGEAPHSVSEDIWPLVFSPAEVDRLQGLDSPEQQTTAAARMFTAKEAYYKCQFPSTRRRLRFKDVSVTLGAGTFAVSSRIDRSGPFADVTGHSLVHAGAIVAVIRIANSNCAADRQRM